MESCGAELPPHANARCLVRFIVVVVAAKNDGRDARAAFHRRAAFARGALPVELYAGNANNIWSRAWGERTRGVWPAGFPEDRRPQYDLGEIRHWLQVFLQRYFGFSQFKRSAMPNGPKVVAGGSLSPRGDWRAPSDGNAAAWLAELEANVPAGEPKA